MSQLMSLPADWTGLPDADSRCHLMHYSQVPTVTCAVQFPTPVSVSSLPALSPNIDNAQWYRQPMTAAVPLSGQVPTSNLLNHTSNHLVADESQPSSSVAIEL